MEQAILKIAHYLTIQKTSLRRVFKEIIYDEKLESNDVSFYVTV
jgi:hypothetical protein